MPNDLDNFSLYVVVTLSGSLNISPDDITADVNTVVSYALMYRPGKPPATAFSVVWYTTAAHTTEVSGSQSPRQNSFIPSTPQTDQDAIDNPSAFHEGTLHVQTPNLPPTSEENTPPTVFYGQVTLHQV